MVAQTAWQNPTPDRGPHAVSNGVPFVHTALFRELTQPRRIRFADVGARGELLEPWRSLGPDILTVLGFEPDEAEAARLSALRQPGRIYLPAAAWSCDGSVSLHLAAEPSTSSVFPPNLAQIECYRDPHWRPRVTQRVVTVPAMTLDTAFKRHEFACDFLKLDVHGSEHEVLRGAREALARDVLGVLVETWTIPVHAGQRLAGDVLCLLAESGFELFDIGVAAAWRRRAGGPDPVRGKQQIIGLDMLFFKRPTAHPDAGESARRSITAAAIADVYGFHDYAIQLLEEEATRNPEHVANLQSARDFIWNIGHPPEPPRPSLARRLFNRLFRRSRPEPDPPYAPLH
jgi:FkbM family methyltransferase